MSLTRFFDVFFLYALVVGAILTAFAVCLTRGLDRWRERRRRGPGPAHPAALPRRVPARERLDGPPRGDGATELLPPRVWTDECGCAWLFGGLFSPCEGCDKRVTGIFGRQEKGFRR